MQFDFSINYLTASCGVFTRLFRRRSDAVNVGHIHALLASRNKKLDKKPSEKMNARSHLPCEPLRTGVSHPSQYSRG